jgi:hypothetical protein
MQKKALEQPMSQGFSSHTVGMATENWADKRRADKKRSDLNMMVVKRWMTARC